MLPFVSIVIPVKESQRTILRCVTSLLDQDYDEYEVILVGDVDDSTWRPIRHLFDDDRLRIIEVGSHNLKRDANPKRNIGLEAAKGEILALTDSDMFMPSDWIRKGVLTVLQGNDCVAGGMVSDHRGFWGLYVDSNIFGAKTPRIPQAYTVDRENFGKRGHKPPITANVFFRREVFEQVGGLDPTFEYTYDDYQWFWKITEAGYSILCSPELMGGHDHRQGFRALGREYAASGHGCADFMRRYKNSPFTRKRAGQLIVLAGLSVAGFLFAPLAMVATIGVLLAALGLYEAWVLRRVDALLYPTVTAVLVGMFYFGVARGLLSRSTKRYILPEPLTTDY